MTVEGNRALIRRLFEEVLNGGKREALEEIISPDQVEHAALPGQEAGGPEGVNQRLAVIRAAFPDLRWDLENVIADEEKAVARWMMEATSRGEFMDIDVYRVASGQVTEHWHEMDTLGLMQQVGVVPGSGPVSS